MKLFDKIRILRKARGLSQEQLGYSLSRVNKDGISRQTVSDWENGKFEPKLENIRDLAEVFDVSFDALLDESIDLDDEKVLYSVLNKLHYENKKEIKKPIEETPKVDRKSIPIWTTVLFIIATVVIVMGIAEFIIMLSLSIMVNAPGVESAIPFPVIYAVLSALAVSLSLVAVGLLILFTIKNRRQTVPAILLIIAAVFTLLAHGVVDFLSAQSELQQAKSYTLPASENILTQMAIRGFILFGFYLVVNVSLLVLSIIALRKYLKERKQMISNKN